MTRRCSLWLLVLALNLIGARASHGEPPRDETKPQSKEDESVLPPGALLRIGAVKPRHESSVGSVHFSPDGKTLASRGVWTVREWNLSTGRQLSMAFMRAGSMAYSPDGRLMALGHQDAAVQMCNVATGQHICT